MSERLTAWFPADVKPELPGWYEREYATEWAGKMYDKWDGKRWWIGNGTGRVVSRAAQKLRWRGLAEDPNHATHEAEALGDKERGK